MTGRILSELKQTRPFAHQADEAALNIMRTADSLRRHMNEALKPFVGFGEIFTKQDKYDENDFTQTPDDLKIQIGANPLQGWNVTVGDLRRARAAITKE